MWVWDEDGDRFWFTPRRLNVDGWPDWAREAVSKPLAPGWHSFGSVPVPESERPGAGGGHIGA
mgnify:CR=1 FL=1